jgi:hypothetical protein
MAGMHFILAKGPQISIEENNKSFFLFKAKRPLIHSIKQIINNK